jgi:competence protein ComEA
VLCPPECGRPSVRRMAASATRRLARDRLALLRERWPDAGQPSGVPPDDNVTPAEPSSGERSPAHAGWFWPVFDHDPVPMFDDGPDPDLNGKPGSATGRPAPPPRRTWWPPADDEEPPRPPGVRHLSLVTGGAGMARQDRPCAGPAAAPVLAGPDGACGRPARQPSAAGTAGPVTDPAGRALGRLRGRLVRRWLPPGAGRWRCDPGRRGALVLAAVVLLGAAVAGFAVWRARPVPEPAPALPTVEAASPAASAGAELVVSVGGAVARPGLVRVPPGARVADALAAAGGPSPGTDLSGVNLARRLTDGEHVVIGGPGPAAASPSGSGSRVDLNTATLAELDALPGVGPVTAQRILDWRQVHGRFASVDQLREVDGIGEARFGQLRDLVMA